jgi:intermediate peptidase
LKTVSDTGDVVDTSPIDDHVAKLFLFDFEQSGIHLEEQHRQKVVHLNDLILQTGQKFMMNSSLPRIIDQDKFPSLSS